MGKAKISIKQKKSLEGTRKMKFKKEGLVEYSPTQELLDEDRISRAVWECLKNNDPEGVIEVIEAHLRAKNKTELSKKNNLARTTMHHAFKGKNPTVKTLAKLVNCCA
jgi:DNA-binding phage protein